jgi:hypothetical protein
VTFIDNEGLEFADLDEAIWEAAQRAAEIEAREVLTDIPPSDGMIIVDDDFRTVLEVPFGNWGEEPFQAPSVNLH